MNKNIIIGVVAVVAILAGGALIYRSSQAPAAPIVPEGQPQNANTNTMLVVGSNAIYVADQKPGSSLTATSLIIDRKGFVAIHADDNGKPGALLGQSKLITTAEARNVPVDLSRSTKNGEVLYAMLHEDDGDGIFNAAKDKAITGPNGDHIYMRFVVDANAEAPGEVSL